MSAAKQAARQLRRNREANIVIEGDWTITAMEWPAVLGIVVTVVLAGFVHGALGLGFPLVATPLIAVFLDVRVAILVTLLPTAAVNIASILTARPSFALLQRYSTLAITSLIGAVAGALVLSISSAEPFKLLLALLILLFLYVSGRGSSNDSQTGSLGRDWLVSNPFTAIVLTGLFGGFSAGTTNVMVAVLIIYFLAMEVDRREMVPAMNLCFLVGKLSQIVVFAVAGLVDMQLLLVTTPLAAIALIALWLGQKLSDKIPQDLYRRMLRYLLALLAIVLLLQFIKTIIQL